MFWVTPSGFVMLLHILLFDRAYNVTYWVNYSELKARLRRRYTAVEPQFVRFHERSDDSVLALRLMADGATKLKVKGYLLSEEAPLLSAKSVDVWLYLSDKSLKECIFWVVGKVGVGASSLVCQVNAAFVGIWSNLACIIKDEYRAFAQVSFSFADRLLTMHDGLFSSLQELGVSSLLYSTIKTLPSYRSDDLNPHLTTFDPASVYDRSLNAGIVGAKASSFRYLSSAEPMPLYTALISPAGLKTDLTPSLDVWGINSVLSLSSSLSEAGVIWDLSDEYFESQAVTKGNSRFWMSRLPALFLNLFFSTGEVYAQLRSCVLKNTLKPIQHLNQFFWLNQPLLVALRSQPVLPWSKSYDISFITNDFFVHSLDYFLDWRELKLEREVWRSLDMLNASRRQLNFRKKYYADLFEPASVTNKVSTWMPNNLIPGWAFVTPFTSRLRYTAVGKVDVALVVVFAASLGSVFSSVNYVITYRYIGAPILKNRRELRSFFVDALLVGSRMMLLANPALLIGILLLLSDRHFNTSVFDFSGGGDTVLFQHLFWFFGHPEVYIIIIPCFGFMNSLLPIYLRKRLSGRLSLQFSMYTIAFMGFAVWGHHMYMVGLANSVRTLYSTMTVMISVPASTKVLHWCVTLIQSTLVLDVGFLFLLDFMYFFFWVA